MSTTSQSRRFEFMETGFRRKSSKQSLEHAEKSRYYLSKGAAARKALCTSRWQKLSDSLGFPVAEVKILRKRFFEHKYNSKRRGVDFLFSFDEWVSCWKNSGKLEQRGCRKGYYVMGRRGGTGPYSLDNVEIILFEDNLVDQIQNINKSLEYRAKMSLIMTPIARQLRGKKNV